MDRVVSSTSVRNLTRGVNPFPRSRTPAWSRQLACFRYRIAGRCHLLHRRPSLSRVPTHGTVPSPPYQGLGMQHPSAPGARASSSAVIRLPGSLGLGAVPKVGCSTKIGGRAIPILSNIAEPDALSLKETLAWAHARRAILVLALSSVGRPFFAHVFCARGLQDPHCRVVKDRHR